MRGIGIALVGAFVLIGGCATEVDDVDSVSSAVGTSADTCRAVAAGRLASGDRFAGVAGDRSGTARGVWIHASPRVGWHRDRLVGHVDSISCEQNGALLITIDGTGRFNGERDHIFRVTIQDRQDPAQADFYRVTVIDPDLELAYTAEGDMTRGDVRSSSD